MARCPLCHSEMKQVSARANPGTLIVLDQCHKCGGIWCDRWELFPIAPEEAPRLDPLDQELLQNPVPLERRPLYCPRCTDRLCEFRDPLLPPEVQLQRCPRCEGIWLNRGQFSRYKRFQKKTRKEKMDGEASLQRLTQAYFDPKSWVTVGTRGIFAYPNELTNSDDWASSSLGGGLRLILQTLLRLAIGF